MTEVRRVFVFGLAVLLAATTAAADTVITTGEVISCPVELADTDILYLELPKGGTRLLAVADVYEVRLSVPSRVTELAAQLPQVRIAPDSDQPIPPPAVRADEMLRLRLDRARKARTNGHAGYAEVLDTLPLGASLNEMSWRCREMEAVLRECGRSDRTVARLLREVRREAEELRRIPPEAAKYCVCAPCGLMGGAIGFLLGAALGSQSGGWEGLAGFFQGGVLGVGMGAACGFAVGPRLGAAMRGTVIRGHRSHVNDLVRRFNCAIVSLP